LPAAPRIAKIFAGVCSPKCTSPFLRFSKTSSSPKIASDWSPSLAVYLSLMKSKFYRFTLAVNKLRGRVTADKIGRLGICGDLRMEQAGVVKGNSAVRRAPGVGA
jgi:hypothetical protein